MNINFDKLKDLKSVDGKDGYSFECEWCHAGSDHLNPFPVGVSYKPYERINGSLLPLKNEDLYGCNIGRELDKLPTLKDALLSVGKEDVFFDCDSCNKVSSVSRNADNEELRRFIKVSYKEDMRY